MQNPTTGGGVVDEKDGACDKGMNTHLKQLNISSDPANNNAESWKRWWQQLELYLLATGLDKSSEKRKIAILLHLIGERGLNIFNTFNLKLDGSTLSEVKSKFDNFFEPRRNVTMSRYAFFTRRQTKSESISDFLTDLEIKSKDCEFGTLRESLIKDIFIANMDNDLSHVRQRLLQEPDLTYERMQELTRTLIVAQQDAEKIVRDSSVPGENVMHLSRKNRGRGDSRQRASSRRSASNSRRSASSSRKSASNSEHSSTRTCGRCGQSHRFKCPATAVQCRSCKNFGHFAKYCLKNKRVSQLQSFNSDKSSQDHFVGMLNSQLKSSQGHKSHSYQHNTHNQYDLLGTHSSQSSQSHNSYSTHSCSGSQMGTGQSSSHPNDEKCDNHSERHDSQRPHSYYLCDETSDESERSKSHCEDFSDEKRHISERSVSPHLYYLCDENSDNQTERCEDLCDEISHISERSVSQSPHLHYLCDENSDSHSERYVDLCDEISHISERCQSQIVQSNQNKKRQHLNDEYGHKSEGLQHTQGHHHTNCHHHINFSSRQTHNSQFKQSPNNSLVSHSEVNYNVNTLENNSKKSWEINLSIGNKQITCIIDSGADVNIISKQTFNYVTRQNFKVSLVKCHVNVTGFGGKTIPILGKVNINCNLCINNSKVVESIMFLVVNLDCPNVLGLPTCERVLDVYLQSVILNSSLMQYHVWIHQGKFHLPY
ncbi:hypothetical protein PYW07_017128 [Mythimna separata]|uniref:Peptidase A2 domain-containing protein n=1 Tax=Mythimna separata TaxID=271217 RepID=A0AAD8DWT7_MYTSE|nr:hypothetical protein PYW07_006788 [Mythimna separata]KAJ8730090.1 hypothetical protein PYW07_017128 [Mythimna separata]